MIDRQELLRLRKIQRLARESPVEGERKAARARLDHLLEKHGLTEADLNPPQPVAPAFRIVFLNPWAWGGFSGGYSRSGTTTNDATTGTAGGFYYSWSI